jgi:hypothetical protein
VQQAFCQTGRVEFKGEMSRFTKHSMSLPEFLPFCGDPHRRFVRFLTAGKRDLKHERK